jgi:hypothetical protein
VWVPLALAAAVALGALVSAALDTAWDAAPALDPFPPECPDELVAAAMECPLGP